MKASVITPTYQREHHLRNLVACFSSQTHRDAELLILDDSPAASPFFGSGEVDDPRIHYLHCPERLSIGEKRNRLIQRSSGEVILHFDDDDYYAPRYIERMLQALEGQDFVKLGSWFAYSVRERQFFYWAADRLLRHHYLVSPDEGLDVVPSADFPADFLHRNLWGYGFSYVFRRSVCEAVPFEDVSWGEDLRFYEGLRARGLRCAHFPDEQGLALHVIHEQNTSRLFPQFLLPSFMLAPYFGPELIAAFEESAAG